MSQADILKIAYLQTELFWEDTGANLAMFEELMWEVHEGTDLIVLPEMFHAGFTMNAAKVAEPMRLTVHRWMLQMAAQTKACICGSFVAAENKQFYNRLLFVRPNGEVEQYDKRHLFTMAGEHQVFSAGKTRLTVALKGWKICPLICYDLRFPVWSRNLAADPYDLLIFLANWPAARQSAWNCLLPARAIENACYCLGVNRLGTDGNQVDYMGHSALYDFKGEALGEAKTQSGVFELVLDRTELTRYREKFPVLEDADRFNLL